MNQNVMLAAIAMVIGGTVTLSDAMCECERIGTELSKCENKDLRYELDVMEQCVELCEARSEAIKDFKDEL